MVDLRTKRTAKKYSDFKKLINDNDGHLIGVCKLCDRNETKSLEDFSYWRIVNNRFPWDKISKTHHMVLPKRHVTEEKLNNKEKEELLKIKASYIGSRYEFIAEATQKTKSVPAHFHLHLIIAKDNL